MGDYIAVLHEGEESIGVQFPDFPGCITVGKDLEDARKQAQEALQFHIEGMREDNDPIPEPGTLDLIKANPDFADADAFFVVTIPEPKTRSKRIQVTFPESDLKAIDEYTKRNHLSRSGFLQWAARQALAARQPGTSSPLLIPRSCGNFFRF